jgi:MoaA/NifB/PqqE/SkfB family radical SAM enzyme
MAKIKLGIAVDGDIDSEVDKLMEECDDLGVSRAEIIEAIPTAYVSSDSDHAEQLRELIIRRRRRVL